LIPTFKTNKETKTEAQKTTQLFLKPVTFYYQSGVIIHFRQEREMQIKQWEKFRYFERGNRPDFFLNLKKKYELQIL
jgi:hypothetical protein